MDKERTTIFREFSEMTEAIMLKGLLEANDIACFISNQDNIYLSNAMTSIMGIRLHILEKDLEKAEAVLLDVKEINEEE